MQEAISNHGQVDKKPHRSGRLQLVLIFITPLLVIGLSSLMFYSGLFLPEGKTNKGELILPPKPVASIGLMHNNGVFTEAQLDGRWAVLVIGDGVCASELCQDAMYQTRQALIALGKESDRVARVYVSTDAANVGPEFRAEHPGIFWLNADESQLLKALEVQSWPSHRYFIVDPLGNVLMQYQPAQRGGDLLKDIKKLLKASKIG